MAQQRKLRVRLIEAHSRMLYVEFTPVRNWARQWAMIARHIEPEEFSTGPEGEVMVEVHQTGAERVTSIADLNCLRRVAHRRVARKLSNSPAISLTACCRFRSSDCTTSAMLLPVTGSSRSTV